MEIKDHTLTKHRILKKYLRACEKFHGKYQNFCYVDTHGGSGMVSYEGKERTGSPLIAANIHPYPCHVVEIDPKRFSCLEESARPYSHISVYNGDCNQKIEEILKQIASWKFIFCFIDPDGLMYHGSKGFSCLQLKYETVEKVANHPKTEILLNFPLESLIRCGAFIKKNPSDARTPKMIEDMDLFFGTPSWIDEEVEKRAYLDMYTERLASYYNYIGAICIRGPTRTPLYYLVYASKHPVGGKIMRDIMKTEWGFVPIGDFDEMFPINRFIFEPYSTP